MGLAVASLLVGSAAAFAPSTSNKATSALNMAGVPFDRPSEALPFSKNGCPATLDGSLPGDAGFDPVGFSAAPFAILRASDGCLPEHHGRPWLVAGGGTRPRTDRTARRPGVLGPTN